MTAIKCRFCGRKARIIPFGEGYVAVCCGRIIYNSYKLPQQDKNLPVRKGTEDILTNADIKQS